MTRSAGISRVRSTRRAPVATIIALLLSATLAGQALAAVSWSDRRAVGPLNDWNVGSGLAISRSTSSGTTTKYLQAIHQREDSSGFDGVFHQRRLVSGGTWSTPKRLSPAGVNAGRAAESAAGQVVYVAHVRFGAGAYDPAAPRRLYVRANGSHGDPPAWTAAREISSCPSCRVDYPSVAASSKDVQVVWTDADSGEVRITGLGPPPWGGSWGYVVQTIGTTSFRDAAEGYHGYPAAAAAGSNLGVAWLSDPTTITARVRSGDTLSAPVTLTTSAASVPSVYALGSRIAFAWTTGGALKVRLWQAGSFTPAVTVATFSSSGAFKGGYAPAVALAGSSVIGVAWANCRRSDCDAVGTSSNGVDLAWRESTDNGATWKPKVTLADSRTTAETRRNDWPSVAFDTPSTRFVLWNGSAYDYSSFRLYFRTGSGSP